MSGVSSQNSIPYFVETLRQEGENDNLVHAVILDLSKSFDSLSHEILLKKMKSLKIFSFGC